MAPWKGASNAKHQRDDEELYEAPASKQVKTTAIKTEDEDMREAAAAWTRDCRETGVWEQDTDESDF